MKRRTKWTLTLISPFALLVVGGMIGVRFNTTPSLPIGFYFASNAIPAKGDIVAFCPEDNSVVRQLYHLHYINKGYCDGGYGFLMKKILAAKKDRISITDSGITVDGKMVPNSKPLYAFVPGIDKNLAQREGYILAEDEVLLLSDVNAYSLDARYFGPSKTNTIQNVITPIFTW